MRRCVGHPDLAADHDRSWASTVQLDGACSCHARIRPAVGGSGPPDPGTGCRHRVVAGRGACWRRGDRRAPGRAPGVRGQCPGRLRGWSDGRSFPDCGPTGRFQRRTGLRGVRPDGRSRLDPVRHDTGRPQSPLPRVRPVGSTRVGPPCDGLRTDGCGRAVRCCHARRIVAGAGHLLAEVLQRRRFRSGRVCRAPAAPPGRRSQAEGTPALDDQPAAAMGRHRGRPHRRAPGCGWPPRPSPSF
jgi:hypothetical protein